MLSRKSKRKITYRDPKDAVIVHFFLTIIQRYREGKKMHEIGEEFKSSIPCDRQLFDEFLILMCPQETVPKPPLFPWGEMVIRKLEEPSVKKQIIWIYDKHNTGCQKPFLKWLCQRYGGGALEGTDWEVLDQYHQYNLAVFDLTLKGNRPIPYAGIFLVKSCCTRKIPAGWNGDYEKLSHPHVVCYADCEPNSIWFKTQQEVFLITV